MEIAGGSSLSRKHLVATVIVLMILMVNGKQPDSRDALTTE